MTTSAEKAAKLAMLNGLLADRNKIRDSTNAANAALNDAVRAGDTSLGPIVSAATSVVNSLNVYKPALETAIAETEAIVPSDPPLPPAEKLVPQRARVGNNATAYWLDYMLQLPWNQYQYLDADGVQRGAKPFATAAPKAAELVAVDVSGILPYLRGDNQGFMLLGTGTFAGGLSTDKPQLILKTMQGDINCPLIISKTLNDAVGPAASMTVPCVLRFDLGTITQASAATLVLSALGAGSFKVFYINTPYLLDDLTIEAKRPNECTAANIIRAHKWSTAQAAIEAGWTDSSPSRTAYILNFNKLANEGVYTRDDGRIDCRMKEQDASGTACHLYWNFPRGEQHDELYVGHTMLWGNDTGDIDGYKLPGMNFASTPWDSDLLYKGSCFLLGHEWLSTANPKHLGDHTYYYDPAIFRSGTSGATLYSAVNGRRVCPRKGVEYYRVQYVKANGFNADGSPKPDGIYRYYVDDSLVYERSGVVFRSDPRVTIHNIIEVLIMHGGVPRHTHAAYYRLGPVGAFSAYPGKRFFYELFGLGDTRTHIAPIIDGVYR